MKEDEEAKDAESAAAGVSVSTVGMMAGTAVFPSSSAVPTAAAVGNLMVCLLLLTLAHDAHSIFPIVSFSWLLEPMFK